MASLKLLWDAARTPGGSSEWERVGLEHARTVARELFRCVWGMLPRQWAARVPAGWTSGAAQGTPQRLLGAA